MLYFRTTCKVSKLNKTICDPEGGQQKKTPVNHEAYTTKKKKMEQWKNKWFVISTFPRPLTQCWVSWEITPCWNKLSLVANLLRIRRQVKTETLRGTYVCQTKSEIALCWCACGPMRLCQIKSEIALCWCACGPMKKWYTPQTRITIVLI